MQIFTTQDLFNMLWTAYEIYRDFMGMFAEEALKLIFLPFHEFSITSAFIAVMWVYIFWKNKGLLFSGLSHIFHIGEWFMNVMKTNKVN